MAYDPTSHNRRIPPKEPSIVDILIKDWWVGAFLFTVVFTLGFVGIILFSK